jgi:hypothetical protein
MHQSTVDVDAAAGAAGAQDGASFRLAATGFPV